MSHNISRRLPDMKLSPSMNILCPAIYGLGTRRKLREKTAWQSFHEGTCAVSYCGDMIAKHRDDRIWRAYRVTSVVRYNSLTIVDYGSAL